MSEPTFREIQLTKKQLVFLFMAMVVLAAVVFLLGVSLGRRLPTAAQAGAVEEPAVAGVSPAEMPPPTILTPDDRKYATELQGTGSVPPATPVPPPTEAPPATQPAAAPAASTTAAPATAQQAAPATAQQAAPSSATPVSKPEPVATAQAPTPAPAAAAGGWLLQVNAFRSRENAESEVRQLKGKGHAAFVSPSGSLFRVRVGPFASRAEADKAAAALRQAGFNPSITR